MLFINFAMFINTYFNFIEVSDEDREIFADCQRTIRRNYREQIFRESVKNFTLGTVDDMEIKKCENPKINDLSIAIF